MDTVVLVQCIGTSIYHRMIQVPYMHEYCTSDLLIKCINTDIVCQNVANVKYGKCNTIISLQLRK